MSEIVFVFRLTVPDGTTVKVEQQPTQGGFSAPAVAGGETAMCPRHGAEHVKESQYGGFYCTAKEEDPKFANPRGYCRWKSR